MLSLQSSTMAPVCAVSRTAPAQNSQELHAGRDTYQRRVHLWLTVTCQAAYDQSRHLAAAGAPPGCSIKS